MRGPQFVGTDEYRAPGLSYRRRMPIADLTPDPVSEYPMTAIRPDLFVVREPEAQT